MDTQRKQARVLAVGHAVQTDVPEDRARALEIGLPASDTRNFIRSCRHGVLGFRARRRRRQTVASAAAAASRLRGGRRSRTYGRQDHGENYS
jgi:hypothetical protein